MSTVANILRRKHQTLVTVTPDTMVVEALLIMADRNIGTVIVVENGNYLGIMTERDYARKVVIKGRRSFETRVSDIMSTDLLRVSPGDNLEHCMTIMSDKHIRYLPVFEENKLVGVVSLLDLIDETVIAQRETISHLRGYISGSHA